MDQIFTVFVIVSAGQYGGGVELCSYVFVSAPLDVRHRGQNGQAGVAGQLVAAADGVVQIFAHHGKAEAQAQAEKRADEQIAQHFGRNRILRDSWPVNDANAAGAGGGFDARLLSFFQEDAEHILIDFFRALQSGHLDGAFDELGVFAAVGLHLALKKALAIAQHIELQLFFDPVLAELFPQILV